MRKTWLGAILTILFGCSALNEGQCSRIFIGESYSLEYNDCLLSMEEHRPATDFEVVTFKSKTEKNGIIASIYKGGSPDVHRLREQESKVVKKLINNLPTEELNEFDAGKNVYSYEGLIELPEDSYGRVFYLHVFYENLAYKKMLAAKKIIESIRSVRSRR